MTTTKRGYKQTDVGVIPDDWEVKTLGTLTSLLTNGFVGIATTSYVEREDGVLYIQGYNVQENGFNFHGIKRVSESFHARNQKSSLRTGDLLTIQTGDVGVTTMVPPQLVGANCHALIISRLRQQESDPRFYSQYFNSENGRIAFKAIETGTAMKHLNCGDMRRILLPVPPLPEQTAIASVLSDIDSLVDALERLIAKKRDIKRAAMHQLLTAKTRLPGFSGEWEVKRLGEIFTISAGGDVSAIPFSREQDANYCFPVYSNALTCDGLYGYSSCYTHPADSVTVTARGTLGVATYRNHAYTAIGRVLVLASIHATSGLFFAESINALVHFAIESTGVPQLTAPQIRRYSVPVPPLPEQTAIAAALSDMDAELAALESRLTKTRDIKRAAMQELLTGRTRLV